MTQDLTISRVVEDMNLRAASFIVTVYGDVVVPRGEVLWTGTLIEICDRVGINESLVRTAVSRLVAAQQLRGERVGRRSYYRLDDAARREFDKAAALLYALDAEPVGWQILHAPELSADTVRQLRLGHMAEGVFVRPDRGQPSPQGALCFHAGDPQDLSALAGFWDLGTINTGYQQFLERFTRVASGEGLSDEAALILRLLLVHGYRGVFLRDPRLPLQALPRNWAGHKARQLFRTAYCALTPAAERWISARVEGPDGPLQAQTSLSKERLEGLRGEKA